jgi:hypothetical protein
MTDDADTTYLEWPEKNIDLLVPSLPKRIQ